jgi:hypothetical protein
LREPDSEASLDHLAMRSASTRALRDALLQSQELRAQPGFPITLSLTGNEPPHPVQVRVGADQQAALFRRVQAVWHSLGEEQPHWSVVTAEDFRPENIAGTLDAFYASGENQRGHTVAHARAQRHRSCHGQALHGFRLWCRPPHRRARAPLRARGRRGRLGEPPRDRARGARTARPRQRHHAAAGDDRRRRRLAARGPRLLADRAAAQSAARHPPLFEGLLAASIGAVSR